ncbi:MAG: hypothetical protein J1E34_07270 [Oscillospiraceae bacterium]|nr:hypothetical protein [Oscillospiraceae bacterium]
MFNKTSTAIDPKYSYIDTFVSYLERLFKAVTDSIERVVSYFSNLF